MAPTLDSLITVPTTEELIDAFAGFLSLAGFPVASWHTGTVNKHVVEEEASLMSHLSTAIVEVAKMGLLSLATGGWLDLLIEEFFDDARIAAVFTQGTVRFTDTGGVGPTTLTSGSQWVGDVGKTLRFTNIGADAIVPLNGYVDVTVQAEFAGSKYNLGTNQIVEHLTPIPGITVSNPSATWITQTGADEETDDEAKSRMKAKWSTLGAGSDDGAYEYRARSASAEVKRVRPFSPEDGTVTVYIAGSTGPVSTTAYDAVNTVIQAKRPLCTRVNVYNGTVHSIPIVGTLYVQSGSNTSAALAAAQAKVNALLANLPLGGQVYRDALIAAIVSASSSIFDVNLTSPAADEPIITGEIPAATWALSVVATKPATA